MAAAHLQAALCLLEREGIDCPLTVPDGTFAGARADNAFSDDARAAGPSTPAERVLSTTVEGLILGQLCQLRPTPHLDAEKLRLLQTSALRAHSYLYGHGKNRAIAVPAIGDRREHNTAISGRVRHMETSIAKLVRGFSSEPAPWTKWWFDLVFSFAFEATENTFDHGRYDLGRNAIRSFRILDFARHNINEIQPRIDDQGGAEGQVVLADYLERLDRHYALQRRRLNTSKLVEITVADGGVGIVGSMARSLAPYADSDPTSELKFLTAALAPRGTSKPAGEIGVGHGIRKMLRACHALRGMFVLRTGRFQLSRTFLDEAGRPGRFNFSDENDPVFDIDHHVARRQMIAGTTWTVIFPMDDALAVSEHSDDSNRGLALAGPRR